MDHVIEGENSECWVQSEKFEEEASAHLYVAEGSHYL